MNFRDFYSGNAFDAYEFFGAHPEGDGVWFRVYAPKARGVYVTGEFSGWKELLMEHGFDPGVYTLYVPDAKSGMMYKYVIEDQNGQKTEHCDPYGFAMEKRPAFASVITDLSAYRFQDEAWVQERKRRGKNYNDPMNIYEMHFASWKNENAVKEREEGEEMHFPTYGELAKELIPYLKENHFNYIECMPLSEHPADCSWGYQNTGFFAPTSRYGSPDELKALIDLCHQNDIGVILDFVPVHFAVDGYGLAKFDGTALYEYDTEDVGKSEWGTCNFNNAKGEVASFLQSSANYWLKEFHFDGIRMDAISRAIYWMGNPDRGVNDRSVMFIKNMNYGLHQRHPEAILIAEDSTDYPKVTAPVEYGGLGFDYKWDMGFMNDTLDYFKVHPSHRPGHYHKLTFSMHYFYSELFLLAFSHDEVVHGKATIVQKMWGDYEQKFPQARALYAYFYTHPGKKLNFMGNEIGQLREWDENRQQDWDMLKYPMHDSFHKYYRDLCEIYTGYPALYNGEYNPECFRWLEVNAAEFSTYVYERKAQGQSVIVMLNFSDQYWSNFSFGYDKECGLKELINSDWYCYSGHTAPDDMKVYITKEDMYGKPYRIVTDIAPFSARVFLVEEVKDEEKTENA
ncbi:MAG: 1,4-alpha-glucan branching protein GlgB [Lachnospiraceae bacterium]|nr:1,4-alpha-glucan branching protein GlgB [Lachnospiraceae bacterium]